MRSKKACPLASRIKRMMQKDDDVGKIAQASPILIGRATELFLQQLCERAAAVAKSRNAKTVSVSHLKASVASVDTLDFLKDAVSSAPDLGANEGDGDPAPRKRRRSVPVQAPIASTEVAGLSSSQAAAAPNPEAAPMTMKVETAASVPSTSGAGGSSGGGGDGGGSTSNSNAGASGAASLRSSHPFSLRPSQSFGLSRRSVGAKAAGVGAAVAPSTAAATEGAAAGAPPAPRPTKRRNKAMKQEQVEDDISSGDIDDVGGNADLGRAAQAINATGQTHAAPPALLSAAASMMPLQTGVVAPPMLTESFGGVASAALAHFHVAAHDAYDDDYDT